MEAVAWLLGTSIDHTPAGIFLHQQKYIQDLIHRFGLQDANISNTPMTPDFQLYPREDPTQKSEPLSAEHRELY